MPIVTYPHGPFTALASNAWVVSARTSQGLPRTMTVGRGDDGALFVHDPLWLDDATFAEFDRLGPVRAIFVPSWLHDFDAQRFAARCPAATLCAMEPARKKLRWPELAPFDPALVPPGITVQRIPGLKFGEAYCEIRHPEGDVTLVFNDALFNLPHGKGLRGFVVRAIGSSGPLKMTRIGRFFLLADRRAFRAFLEEQAARKIRHVVVAHGRVASENVAALLAAAAARI